MHVELKGDKAVAKQWYGYAKRQLVSLKQFMAQQRIEIFHRYLPVAAGVMIFVGSSFGVDTIRIEAAGGPELYVIFLIQGPKTGLASTGTVSITGGGGGGPGGNAGVDMITVGGINIMSGPESDANRTVLAGLVASNINAYVSTPDYTASADGEVVTIEASGEENGEVVTPTFAVGTLGSSTDMADGLDGDTAIRYVAWEFDSENGVGDELNYVPIDMRGYCEELETQLFSDGEDYWRKCFPATISSSLDYKEHKYINGYIDRCQINTDLVRNFGKSEPIGGISEAMGLRLTYEPSTGFPDKAFWYPDGSDVICTSRRDWLIEDGKVLKNLRLEETNPVGPVFHIKYEDADNATVSGESFALPGTGSAEDYFYAVLDKTKLLWAKEHDDPFELEFATPDAIPPVGVAMLGGSAFVSSGMLAQTTSHSSCTRILLGGTEIDLYFGNHRLSTGGEGTFDRAEFTYSYRTVVPSGYPDPPPIYTILIANSIWDINTTQDLPVIYSYDNKNGDESFIVFWSEQMSGTRQFSQGEGIIDASAPPYTGRIITLGLGLMIGESIAAPGQYEVEVNPTHISNNSVITKIVGTQKYFKMAYKTKTMSSPIIVDLPYLFSGTEYSPNIVDTRDYDWNWYWLGDTDVTSSITEDVKQGSRIIYPTCNVSEKFLEYSYVEQLYVGAYDTDTDFLKDTHGQKYNTGEWAFTKRVIGSINLTTGEKTEREVTAASLGKNTGAFLKEEAAAVGIHRIN